MLDFHSKDPERVRKALRKPKLAQIVIMCLTVLCFLTSFIYAFPLSGNDDAANGASNLLFDTLFPFGNNQESAISFKITDPLNASSDPEIALSNQFKFANLNKLSLLAPGDKLDLSYEITNTGTDAIDIRETYYILSVIPQSGENLDFAMFSAFTLAGSGDTCFAGTSPLPAEKLDEDGRLYCFTSEIYTLSGSGEIVGGAPSAKRSERYMVFNCFGGNQTQGETILVVATLEYKLHSDKDWEPPIKEIITVGGYTETMEYRAGTDVYLSCDIIALDNINPDNPGYVTFTVADQTGAETVLTFDDFYSPAIGIQRAYVPFHIPDVTGELTVTISSSENVFCDIKEIIGTVVSSDENTPPDPTMDMVPARPGALPTFRASKSHEWITYSAHKNADGQWEYEKHTHTASLSAVFLLLPDSSIKTAVGSTIASGYGVAAEIKSNIIATDPIYNIQNVYCFFPEFSYKDYSRKLEIFTQEVLTATWEFQTNPYSHSNSRVHYIPPAYPDGLYTVFAIVRDAWTPVGELKGSVTAEVIVSGSLYDDWYVTQTD